MVNVRFSRDGVRFLKLQLEIGDSGTARRSNVPLAQVPCAAVAPDACVGVARDFRVGIAAVAELGADRDVFAREEGDAREAPVAVRAVDAHHLEVGAAREVDKGGDVADRVRVDRHARAVRRRAGDLEDVLVRLGARHGAALCLLARDELADVLAHELALPDLLLRAHAPPLAWRAEDGELLSDPGGELPTRAQLSARGARAAKVALVGLRLEVAVRAAAAFDSARLGPCRPGVVRDALGDVQQRRRHLVVDPVLELNHRVRAFGEARDVGVHPDARGIEQRASGAEVRFAAQPRRARPEQADEHAAAVLPVSKADELREGRHGQRV
eukprot:CAMPEP_0119404316 /NCGR_PEP_ID=MMETSP1334-20130426/143833_1 /TAXON_ID=127549 /ORGANISM="Calcidiscus leptoporus, Strain RCC1130" /LENGTH=326 /DNA_ID=CAMNT_0007428281 /DNA_START=399 /DNA_END=1377 /DNA_ORIENTATION=+